jgi:DNA anti-recombination protein RmuC
MTLSAEQKKFYEQTMAVTKKEIADLEGNIQDELAKVKERLAELQNAQKAARQMYDAACTRLGVPNDLEEAESAS